MRAILRDGHGNECAFDREDGVIEFMFAGREHPFTCQALPSDDGIDPEIDLEFTEWLDESGQEGLTFCVGVDRATNGACIPPDLEPAARSVLEEFNREVTPRIMARFRSEAARVRDHLRRSRNYVISSDEVLEGNPIAWAEVFHPDLDWRECAFTVVSGGSTYLLLDTYCPDPDCDCAGPKMRVYRQVEGSDPPDLEFVFEAVTDLEGTYLNIVDTRLGEEDVRAVLDTWKEGTPDLDILLEDRYDDIKDLGARVLHDIGDWVGCHCEHCGGEHARGGDDDQDDEDDGDDGDDGDWEDDFDEDFPDASARPVVPVGRNAPCPCGSGLKYKKCCLRKDEDALRET